MIQKVVQIFPTAKLPLALFIFCWKNIIFQIADFGSTMIFSVENLVKTVYFTYMAKMQY